MAPRGVAIPDVREQLFEATERILVREGPVGLSSRAITTEASVAKGILYNHFTNLDVFLAEFVDDRAQRISESAITVQAMAGKATVERNLADAALSVFGSDASHIATLVMARPGLMKQLELTNSPGMATFKSIEDAFMDYLNAEKRIGRIVPDADTRTIALTLVGTVHHLFMTGRGGHSDLRKQVRRVVRELMVGVSLDSESHRTAKPGPNRQG